MLKVSEGRSSLLGVNHIDTLKALTELCLCLRETGDDYPLCIKLYVKLLGLQKRKHGSGSSEVYDTMYIIGNLYKHEGNFDKAEYYLSHSLSGYESIEGTYHPITLNIIDTLANLQHVNLGKKREAYSLYYKMVEVWSIHIIFTI